MWITYSGYENSVVNSLTNVVENNSLQDKIFDIKVPVIDDFVERNGKRKPIQRKKFPSYVFIKMIYTNQIWFIITQTRGVTGFVGPAGRPLPLRDEEVKRMGLEAIALEDFDVKAGDFVKVINGPLENFTGTVDSINEETNKVKVVVSMFGRPTSVELEFTQVEKI